MVKRRMMKTKPRSDCNNQPNQNLPNHDDEKEKKRRKRGTKRKEKRE
jgi:hypothetical protein